MKYFKSTILFASLLVFTLAAATATATAAFAQTGVKGKVRTARGAGISGATVTARQKGEDLKTVTTDANGEFVLEGLDDGLYNFVFTKSGFSTGTKYNVEVKKNKITDLGDRLILTTDQGTLVIVKGSVFNQDGVSLYGAKIEIERISENGSARKVGTSYTSESGEFTFRFPEGAAKFRVTASVKDIKASKEVEVGGEAAVYRTAITLNLPKNN